MAAWLTFFGVVQVDNLSASGYAMSQLVDQVWLEWHHSRSYCSHTLRWLAVQLTEGVLERDLTDAQKGRMFEALAQTDKCLADGADEDLQLMKLAAQLNRVATGTKLACDDQPW